MKAISLWQPWASAIAVGAKRIETRSWPTSYRGPLAIHAAKRRVVEELIRWGCCWNWCGALRPLGRFMGEDELEDVLPFGGIVAVCRLADCRPTDSFTQAELLRVRMPEERPGEMPELYAWNERQMGNFDLGRFGWVLEDVRRIDPAIPWKGKQGFFDVPDDLFK